MLSSRFYNIKVLHAELRTFCAVHINNIYIYIIVITVSSTLFLSNKWATSSKIILNKSKSKMAACFRSSVKICNDRYFFLKAKGAPCHNDYYALYFNMDIYFCSIFSYLNKYMHQIISVDPHASAYFSVRETFIAFSQRNS